MQEIQKWEYIVICMTYSISDNRNKLAELGNQGWELVAVGGNLGSEYIFKRPKIEINNNKNENHDSFYAKHGYTEEQDRMYTQMLYGTKQDA